MARNASTLLIEQSASHPDQGRPMVRGQMMGAHTHATASGTNVHIYRRGASYLARGRYQGRMFGMTLGVTEAEAKAKLCELLVNIDNGCFIRPSESRKRLLSSGKTPRLTLRQLADEFLGEKRKLKGQLTATTYRSRLGPVLDFAEQSATRQRWPLARDIDRDFVVELRSFLSCYRTTRNGRLGATPKLLSSRQTVNILECLRTLLGWARKPEVRKLGADWINPMTQELIGKPPAKDPLREDKLPLQVRLRLLERMDAWQLCHLSLQVLLPLRPEEATGLLVSDVDLDKGRFAIGTRLDGSDFTKGRTSFVLPFPDELRPLLNACIGDRAEGPLLRDRKAFEGGRNQPCLSSHEALVELYHAKLAKAPSGSLCTEQDRKQVFRHLLREVGGVTGDQLAKEFKGLLEMLALSAGVSLYTLRSSVTTSMSRARLPHLEMRYLTSHAINDILNRYVGLDPVGAMRLYFDAIRPLLDAVAQRTRALGIPASSAC